MKRKAESSCNLLHKMKYKHLKKEKKKFQVTVEKFLFSLITPYTYLLTIQQDRAYNKLLMVRCACIIVLILRKCRVSLNWRGRFICFERFTRTFFLRIESAEYRTNKCWKLVFFARIVWWVRIMCSTLSVRYIKIIGIHHD
jgi:hypothetical protein